MIGIHSGVNSVWNLGEGAEAQVYTWYSYDAFKL